MIASVYGKRICKQCGKIEKKKFSDLFQYEIDSNYINNQKQDFETEPYCDACKKKVIKRLKKQIDHIFEK